MSKMKGFLCLIVAALMLAGATACSEEGPAEKAGKEIDRAADKVKKAFD